MAFASYYQLDNMVAIMDVNRLGQSEAAPLKHDMETYRKRCEAFGSVLTVFHLYLCIKHLSVLVGTFCLESALNVSYCQPTITVSHLSLSITQVINLVFMSILKFKCTLRVMVCIYLTPCCLCLFLSFFPFFFVLKVEHLCCRWPQCGGAVQSFLASPAGSGQTHVHCCKDL